MGRMKFDSQGKLVAVDGSSDAFGNRGNSGRGEKKKYDIWEKGEEEEGNGEERIVRKSEERVLRKVEGAADSGYWSLYRNGKKLEPLKFSNGKSQEDVVKEIVELIRGGNKAIFLHGMCGTGKSAIALNIARVLGKAAIVVPVKGLQRQYEEDYMGQMYVAKENGEELKIAIITGRDNHDSVFRAGVSCADTSLPDTIQIVEKNFNQLKEYYEMNPLIKHKEMDDIKTLRRISIAPANPYWSPIVPAEYEFQLKDAKKKRYMGLRGREFIFYHRKKGCSYYDQYQSYIDADVIIFNAAKYKIEVALDRKPETEVDIIDEADEFLDSFSNQVELNLTRLYNSLSRIVPEDAEVYAILDTIKEIISLEEKNKRAIGVDEDKVFHIDETSIGKILTLFLKNKDVASEISLDDYSYANKAIECAKQFADSLDDTYLTYKKYEDNLIASLVSINLAKKMQEVLDKNKAVVFMSGTLHSENVLKKVFGIKEYKTVEAETVHQGEIEISRTGREFDCSYKNFKSGAFTKDSYFESLASCIDSALKPLLIHVNSYDDLPSRQDMDRLGINIMTKDKLIELQSADKTGRLISLFKQKLSDFLYSTKCSRGVDFPGDICKSMVFTKYPNPNVQGTFWKILERTHPSYFWDFYKDKARREFLQRLYRALRSKEDHVYVLSPDSRVLEAVRNLQLAGFG